MFRYAAVHDIRTPDTAAFLADFRTTAAELLEGERVMLCVSSLERLKVVLDDPLANVVAALIWTYGGVGDVNVVASQLVDCCPDLRSLQVEFEHMSEFDFVAAVLECPNNKVVHVKLPRSAKMGITRCFDALMQSRVTSLRLSFLGVVPFSQGLCDFLACDKLTELTLDMCQRHELAEVMAALTKCTRMETLFLSGCKFTRAGVTFPRSITSLTINYSVFCADFDWSLLADSNVQKMSFTDVDMHEGVAFNFGSYLAVLLRMKGMESLELFNAWFAKEALVAIGSAIQRVETLKVNEVDDAAIGTIALALQTPGNRLRSLYLTYEANTQVGMQTQLLPALKGPNCELGELVLFAYGPHCKITDRVARQFRGRHRMFALLLGRLVRRIPNPLQRLPVEMFRLVGEMVI